MIKIAKHFFEIGNTSGLMALIPVFTVSSIHRLKPVWDAISKNDMEKIEKWLSLLSPQGNYKQYREYLSSRTPPTLPFIGLFLTDLTYSNESLKTFVNDDNKTINFERLRVIGKAVYQIHSFQKIGYEFQQTKGFVKPIFQRYQYNDKQFLKLSHALFPLRDSQLEMIKDVVLVLHLLFDYSLLVFVLLI